MRHGDAARRLLTEPAQPPPSIWDRTGRRDELQPVATSLRIEWKQRPGQIPGLYPSVRKIAASARRPSHMPATQQVQMQMVYRLAAVIPCVHHDPVTITQVLFMGNRRCSTH